MFSLFDQEDWGFIIKIILTLLAVASGWFGYITIPDMLEAKRAAVKGSSGYIEAKQSKLMKLAEEYNDCKLKIKQLELGDSSYTDLIEDYKAQKGVLLEAIKMESVRIPDHELPKTVLKILE
jgi:hypothetical protein